MTDELWSYEVSTLYLENCAYAGRIYVLWVINSLFLTLWGILESSTSPRPVPESIWRTYLWRFNCILKTVQMHVKFLFLSG